MAKFEIGKFAVDLDNLTETDIVNLLSLSEKEEIEKLFKAAYSVKEAQVGKVCYFRGIIELSNICEKNCYYCGIRKDNKGVERYFSTMEEVVEAAQFIMEAGYGSLVIQSGERQDQFYIDFIDQAINEIKKLSDGKIGITLSCGEQTKETYQRWFKSGAHRYLLRIETTNPQIYANIHPADHSFTDRLNCLKLLKEVGFQVGTGVMIGLPNQTMSDLAKDILFFKELDIDMIGIGPFIPHSETPLGSYKQTLNSERYLELALKMVAVTRLFLKDVNIAATTALQALKPNGRELGLQAGANIIMPNVTETKYRTAYTLYENKPCTDENASMCRGCLEKRISSIGETIGYNQWGDSKHFANRGK